MDTFNRICCILYSFVYSLPDDSTVEAETCRKDIINDK